MSQLALFSDSAAPPSASPGVAHLFPAGVLYVSPVMTIGRHQWAFVIYESLSYGLSNDYVWRRPDAAHGSVWERSGAWHSYDRDRWDNGLPLTLAQLWGREAPARAEHGLS